LEIDVTFFNDEFGDFDLIRPRRLARFLLTCQSLLVIPTDLRDSWEGIPIWSICNCQFGSFFGLADVMFILALVTHILNDRKTDPL
jgi:hypothetical protein